MPVVANKGFDWSTLKKKYHTKKIIPLNLDKIKNTGNTMKILQLKNQNRIKLLKRSQIDSNSVLETVRDIVSDVEKNQDNALRKYLSLIHI